MITEEFQRIEVAGEPEPVFADGIYFGMTNEAYHADPALGSSNLRDLLTGGPTYWWNSTMNPSRKRERSRALDFGSAAHAMVLEGESVFLSQFAEEPDPEGALVTYEDVKRWLQDRGEAKVPRAKAEAAAQALLVDPTVRILDVEKQRIKDAGKAILSDDDWARIQVAAAVIRNHPDTKDAFRNGIAEVSVFWTVDGVRVKCRFDYIKPRANVDLKTLGNTMGKPFPHACTDAIARHRMDVQASHYMDGRRQFSALYAAGKVFGQHNAKLVERIAAVESATWAWVFIQSVEAPLVWPVTMSPQNPILEIGGNDVAAALREFRTYMDRFGRDQMWLSLSPISELDQSELPGWWKMR